MGYNLHQSNIDQICSGWLVMYNGDCVRKPLHFSGGVTINMVMEENLKQCKRQRMELPRPQTFLADVKRIVTSAQAQLTFLPGYSTQIEASLDLS